VASASSRWSRRIWHSAMPARAMASSAGDCRGRRRRETRGSHGARARGAVVLAALIGCVGETTYPFAMLAAHFFAPRCPRCAAGACRPAVLPACIGERPRLARMDPRGSAPRFRRRVARQLGVGRGALGDFGRQVQGSDGDQGLRHALQGMGAPRRGIARRSSSAHRGRWPAPSRSLPVGGGSASPRPTRAPRRSGRCVPGRSAEPRARSGFPPSFGAPRRAPRPARPGSRALPSRPSPRPAAPPAPGPCSSLCRSPCRVCSWRQNRAWAPAASIEKVTTGAGRHFN
jgi:hypothetical protein